MSLDLFLRHLSDPRPRFECEPAGSPQDIRTEVEISHRLRPPALVRELIDWTSRLRSHVPRHQRNHLFLMKPRWRPTAATRVKLHRALERFIAAHALKPFTFSSVRPSVLTALYRSSGDLRAVKEMANHASISTTVRYVQGPEVAAQNSLRMAALQSALLGHVETSADDRSSTPPAAPTDPARRLARLSRFSDLPAKTLFPVWRRPHAGASSARTSLHA